MQTIDILRVNELDQHTDELLQDAAYGRLVVLTNYDQPAFLAIPFNERLLNYGWRYTVALSLFEQGILTLSQAAHLAELALEDFIELLGKAGVPAVDYAPEELDAELANTL